jgi:hypothetical protein
LEAVPRNSDYNAVALARKRWVGGQVELGCQAVVIVVGKMHDLSDGSLGERLKERTFILRGCVVILVVWLPPLNICGLARKCLFKQPCKSKPVDLKTVARSCEDGVSAFTVAEALARAAICVSRADRFGLSDPLKLPGFSDAVDDDGLLLPDIGLRLFGDARGGSLRGEAGQRHHRGDNGTESEALHHASRLAHKVILCASW